MLGHAHHRPPPGPLRVVCLLCFMEHAPCGPAGSVLIALHRVADYSVTRCTADWVLLGSLRDRPSLETDRVLVGPTTHPPLIDDSCCCT
jgi:hypothetical protein